MILVLFSIASMFTSFGVYDVDASNVDNNGKSTAQPIPDSHPEKACDALKNAMVKSGSPQVREMWKEHCIR